MPYLLKGIPPLSPAIVRHLKTGGVLLFALVLSLAPLQAEPPEEGPISKVFVPDDLQGETNIWKIVQTADGQIIAGGERLSFYQDNRWQVLPQPRKQAIRGLVVDGTTLWVASQSEIGRIELPLTVNSRYEPLVLPEIATAGNFWHFVKRGNTLVATTNEEVWIVSLGSKEVHRTSLPNKSRLFLLTLGGKLIVVQPGTALWEITGQTLRPFENPLPDKTDILWRWCDPNFVVTARALYQREKGGDSYRLVTGLRPVSQAVITSVSLWGELIAITTYNRGLVLADPAAGTIRFTARPVGLTTSGTTYAFEDREGRLWVGTSQGILIYDALRFGRRLSTRDDPVRAAQAGDLVIGYDDRTERYNVDGSEERLERAYAIALTPAGLAIGLWGKTQVGKTMFETGGNRVGAITGLPNGQLLVSAGERMYLLDPVAQESHAVTGPSTEISSFTVAGGVLWAATYEGFVFRSPPVPPFAFSRVTALPSATTTKLHRLGDTFVAATSDSVHFGEKLRIVENTPGLRSARLATTGDGTLWLLGQQEGKWRLGRVRQNGDAAVWETVEAKGLTLLPEVHDLSASGGALLISAGAGILELNTDELRRASRLAAPRLEFTFRDPKTGAILTGSAPPPELEADTSSLTFSGTLPFDELAEKPAFERRLLPTDTAWVPTTGGETVAYPSLSSRHYTLEVRATHLGHTGPVLSHAFTVLPPWYQSPAAFGGYAVFAGMLGFLTYRLRTHQIRRRNQELERIVEQRTHALAEASAAKTEFLASMSHEIRNPMNGVIGLVNILREQPGLPRQANTLRLLHGCAEQLRSTVDDILDFSKIEARAVGLELSTFDLLDTLEAAAATVDPGGASIVFSDKPPEGVSLRGDAAKLRQIFANYLNNALKYGVPPGARVSSILTSAGDGVRLTLSVSSTGPTIEKDKLDKMFESFTRGDDAIERNIRGTGLGLAICKRYAEAMGGEVGAVSTNGETTFYLNVPFEKLSPAPVPAPEAAFSTPHPTLPARALAIEDEDYNRIVLGDILTKMNYTVDWATTGAEALQLAQENGYDIILTDYRLPDTNGVELTKKILQLCPVPKPAVFAVTAYSTRERRDECLAAGMSGFISKPITLEKLRTTLFSWGDSQLTKISLEASIRPFKPTRRHAEIEEGWVELKHIAATDAKQAAGQAHRLNNLCRSLHQIDIAEQLELLEGALERGEPTGQLVAAIERLLRA